MTHHSSAVTRAATFVAVSTLVVLAAWQGAQAQFAGEGQDVFATSSSLCVIIDGLSYGSLIKAVDPGTLVGRSNVFIDGTPPDTLGSPVPIAGCPVCDPNVADSDLTCWPAAAPETGTHREIHTEMLDLHLCHSCNACTCAPPHGCDTICYLAGQSAYDALDAVGQAAKYRNSYGEVESQNAAANPAADFPATSFFDIKGVVTITPAPGGTSGVFVLADPTDSILMVNGALMAFPPSPGDEYDIHAGTKAPGGGGGACSVCNIPIADAVSGVTVGVICCPPVHHDVEPPPPERPGCPTIEVPGDGSFSVNERAPNTNFAFGRAVYLIPQSEMKDSGLKNGAFINAIGWRYAQAGTAGSGNLQVYLENTADTTNTKSTTWSTAISGMTSVTNSSVFLPSQTSYFDVFFTVDIFPYTGGGLYVAFDWQLFGSPGSGTTVATDTSLAGGLKGANGTASPPTTITASNFRPETRLTPSTGLSNDLSVDLVQTLGEFPLGIGSPHTVHGVVTNKGANNNLATVSAHLDVGGSETFSDSQFFSPLAACGEQVLVAFSPFSPTATGTDSVRVSVADDSRTANDSSAMAMSVNPNRYSYKHPGSTATSGGGFASPGQLVAKFPLATSTQIDAVTLEFFSASAATYRAVIYGDNGGGQPGAQLYLDAADRTIPASGPVTVRLPSPLAVSAGNVFAGAQQTNSTNYGLSFDREIPIRTDTFYETDSLSPSGPWTDFAPATPFKINVGINVGACLVPLTVDVTPNGTSLTCAGTQLAFSAAASGGTGAHTYQWTENGVNIPGATASTLNVTKGSPGSFTYNCKVTDDAGCTNIADASAVGGSWGGNGATCSDGDPCTAGETCLVGLCSGGSPTPPAEVQGVLAAGNKTTYSWTAVSGATRYDGVRGSLNGLPVGPGGGDEACFSDLPGPTLDDATVPLSGSGFWYLPRAESDCGTGTYGNQSNGTPRTSSTCP